MLDSKKILFTQENDLNVSFEEYRRSLICLKNVRGQQIFGVNDESIKKLWNLKANLSQLLKLFNYTCSQKYEKFFSKSTVCFLENGYFVSDLLIISNLKDHSSNFILDSSNDFYSFVKIKGKVEEAVEIANIKDSEEKTIYRREPKIIGFDGFDGFEAITSLLKVGGNAIIVKKLASICADDGISVFRTPRDINRFVESSGTFEYAKTLLDLRDNEGKQIFNEFSIGLFKEGNGLIEYAAELTSIKDSEGQTVFSKGIDVCDFLKYWSSETLSYIYNDIEIARNFAGLLDSEGKTVFRDGSDISAFVSNNGTIEEAQDYISIKDENGRTY